MAQPLYPLLLDPTLHTRVWGGRRLETVLHKRLPTSQPYGESWEMHDTALVANGPLAGQTLGEVLAAYGSALIGTRSDPRDGIPLLVKFLDASDWLSIQVHPNDAQAAALEGEPRGKTEAWYILDTAPEGRLVVGVQPGLSQQRIASAVETNTLEEVVVYAQVNAGDVLFIPAGTIHAIGPGLLIYEIQQSSDITYRLYDWGRMGLDGKPRPLHVEKSLQVANTQKPAHTHQPDGEVVVSCPYFITLLKTLNANSLTLDTGGAVFHALTCIEGSLSVQAGDWLVEMPAGRTVFVPATTGRYVLSGRGRALASFQPPA